MPSVHLTERHPSRAGNTRRSKGREEKKKKKTKRNVLQHLVGGVWGGTGPCDSLCTHWHHFWCSSGMIERNWQSLPQLLINELIHLLAYFLNPFFFIYLSYLFTGDQQACRVSLSVRVTGADGNIGVPGQ